MLSWPFRPCRVSPHALGTRAPSETLPEVPKLLGREPGTRPPPAMSAADGGAVDAGLMAPSGDRREGSRMAFNLPNTERVFRDETGHNAHRCCVGSRMAPFHQASRALARQQVEAILSSVDRRLDIGESAPCASVPLCSIQPRHRHPSSSDFQRSIGPRSLPTDMLMGQRHTS